MTGSKLARKSGWLGVSLVILLLLAASASVSKALDINDGETYTISTGQSVTEAVVVKSGGTLILDGGTVQPTGFVTAVTAEAGSSVMIYSGTMTAFGGGLYVLPGADITFYGYSFFVDGAPHEPGTISAIVAEDYTIQGNTGSEPPTALYSILTSLDAGASVTLALVGSGGNESPVAVDDSAKTTVNTPVTINVLTGDFDPDGDELSVDSLTQPANGSTADNGDGTVTYTPGANFVGIDAFTYTISDGNGGTASATVTVTVNSGSIDIDIRPGSASNRIYVWCPRFIPVLVPVAIFSTEGFDATALDPGKIFLAGAGVLQICGWGDRYLSTEFDVNKDGRLDLLVVVKIDPEDLDPDPFPDGTAYLRVHAAADPTSDVLYEGSDHIEIVRLY